MRVVNLLAELFGEEKQDSDFGEFEQDLDEFTHTHVAILPVDIQNSTQYQTLPKKVQRLDTEPI
jgi:hypothetical protein